MRLEGSLTAFALADVLRLLGATGKTGCLHMTRDEPVRRRGAVWFSAGAVVAASPDRSRHSLARRLVGSAGASRPALEEALGLLAAEEPGHGGGPDGTGVVAVLARAAGLEPDRVAALAREQVADALAELQRWSAGDFVFELGAVPPEPGPVSIPVDEAVALAEATAEPAGPGALAAGTVLRVVAVVDDPVTLTAQEWLLLAHVDGRRSVGELVDELGLPRAQVAAALASLAARGLLAGHDADRDVQQLADQGSGGAAGDGPYDGLLARLAMLADLEARSADEQPRRARVRARPRGVSRSRTGTAASAWTRHDTGAAPAVVLGPTVRAARPGTSSRPVLPTFAVVAAPAAPAAPPVAPLVARLVDEAAAPPADPPAEPAPEPAAEPALGQPSAPLPTLARRRPGAALASNPAWQLYQVQNPDASPAEPPDGQPAPGRDTFSRVIAGVDAI